MRVVLGAMVACAAGCGNLLGIDNFSLGDAGGDGVVADAARDGGDACYGPTGWQLCFARPPTGAITLSNETFDTDSNAACEPANPWTNAAQPLACVIASGTILVSDKVLAVGVRPLVLLATDTIDITGTLDIAHGGSAGTRAACNPFATAPGANGLDAGGGAGGSFINAAGNGGNGGGSTAGGTVAPAVGVPDTLVGGCPGQTGGGAGGGVSGPGGGAVFILANNGLTISGTINASGSGGGGGSAAGGGGGGGSGGAILIYASAISATGATLIANGGGGGGGFSSTPGLKGSDPDPTMPNTPALGGPGGGTGGNGFASATAATAGSPANNGGGGGGGGASGTIDTNVSAPGGVIAGATASPSIGQLF